MPVIYVFKSLMNAKEFVRAVVVRYNVDHDCLWLDIMLTMTVVVRYNVDHDCCG
jgi:hypothetical protein